MLKKLKMTIQLLILLFVAVTVFQNQEFIIDQKNDLTVNLLFYQLEWFEIPMYYYFLGCFLIGFLAASYFTITKHFRTKKIIKIKNEEINYLKNQLSQENYPSSENNQEDIVAIETT